MLPDRSAQGVLSWFHEQVVCRYGEPLLVHSDHGGKFDGPFASYLAHMGVEHAVISTAHPRANGLVERYNQCIKRGFCKMSSAFPDTPWHEHLGDILAGLRILPTKLGWSPYLLVFK